jgi:small subunit ribosomal protein S8
MTMTDPIADLLTHIRNGLNARKKTVTMPTSKVKAAVCDVLKREGWIEDYSISADGIAGALTVKLKYDPDGMSVIREIQRSSKPGRRQYYGVTEMPRVVSGHGISVISTSRGMMSDREARKARVGGECLCTVF